MDIVCAGKHAVDGGVRAIALDEVVERHRSSAIIRLHEIPVHDAGQEFCLALGHAGYVRFTKEVAIEHPSGNLLDGLVLQLPEIEGIVVQVRCKRHRLVPLRGAVAGPVADVCRKRQQPPLAERMAGIGIDQAILQTGFGKDEDPEVGGGEGLNAGSMLVPQQLVHRCAQPCERFRVDSKKLFLCEAVASKVVGPLPDFRPLEAERIPLSGAGTSKSHLE